MEGIFRVAGALDGPPQMPNGNFILDNAPWSAVDAALHRRRQAARHSRLQAALARMGRDGLASSVNLLLPDAEQTGKLTSIANAVVREITVDKNTGLPNGCNFVDRLSRREMSVKARVVVLAAGTLESTRLLLNSNLANSSGLVGRYLMDQIYGAGIVCSVPEARNGKQQGRDGRRRHRSALPQHRQPSATNSCAATPSTSPAATGGARRAQLRGLRRRARSARWTSTTAAAFT